MQLPPFVVGSMLILAAVAAAGDWPAYRGDASRSGVADGKLSYPLEQAWQYRPAQGPQPAWPEPGRHLHRTDFDYAFQPVVAGGLVYLASSADDTLRALDSRTGAERWHFIARGPLRFAPHLADGRCYIAGDDGYVYCLDAANGRLVWEFRAALNERMMLGNGRMISRWPCRSGVLVADGIAYVTAGMWPSEGVYIYALDATTGKVRWCNDTSSSLYLPHPHASSSFGGPAPQGYLVLAGDILLVPTGQSAPSGVDRRTGRLLYCNITPGSSTVTLAGNLFFTQQVRQTTEDHDIIQIGENGPGEGDALVACDLTTGAMPPKGTMRFGLPDRECMLYHDRTVYAAGGGVVEALAVGEEGDRKKLWTAKHGRAYAMALAGDVILTGGTGTINAVSAADGKTVWQTSVRGEVRGLAIADGQLLAATDDGAVTCFSRSAGKGTPEPAAAAPQAAPAPEPAALTQILGALPQPESLQGYALVIGEPDARLAEALSNKTRLHMISVLQGRSARDEKERLVSTTRLYGSRVSIQEMADATTLPFADFFANLVVVSGNAAGISLKDLYRVLRPCGGTMAFVGNAKQLLDKDIADAGIPQAEVVTPGDHPLVVRGKLPGAYDWNSEVKCDQRVKWPLEMLWFGGPGPSRMVARHWKAPTPVFANGRTFIIGQYHLIGVDAYNGRELWCRQVGGNVSYKILKVTADDNHVYAAFNGYTAEFDARTGTITKLYGQPPASPRFTLDQKRSFPLDDKLTRYGSVEVQRSANGVEIVLTSALPAASPKDSWQVNLDFRPLAKQYADEGPGAFRLLIMQADGAWRAGLGGPVPPLQVTTTDNVTRVNIALQDLKELLGHDPAAFRFAATLQRFPKGPLVRAHEFADGLGTFLNDGWATFVLDEAKVEAPDFMPVAVAGIEQVPAIAKDWPRQPTQFTADWTLGRYDHLELPQWPPVDRGAGPATRKNPFTGTPELLDYVKSHGCGGTIQSLATDFFRSGTLGIYDRVDDSGLRNISAMRPGCGMTLMPAGGILMSAEGQADCSCSFNFQTSLALAPAARQRDEDWALHDATAAPGLLSGTALNLGAPGDRRDAKGRLWLAFPRPAFPAEPAARNPLRGKETRPASPCRLEWMDGFGPSRVNAERERITGTDQPWVFASCVRGLQKATLDLVLGRPEDCLAFGTSAPPRVDGKLDDRCWTDLAALNLPEQKAKVYLRHDTDNLYLAARLDDSNKPFTLTLRGDKEPVMARFTVDADGTCHAARLDSALRIPRLGRIAIDGKSGDWGEGGVTLPLPGKGVCRFGWTDQGLAMLTEVPKDFSAQGADLTGLFALFFRPGSSGFLQCSIDAKNQSVALAHRIRKSTAKPDIPIQRNVSGLMHWDHDSGETVPPSPEFRTENTKTDEAMIVEALFPWSDLCIEPARGGDLAFQIAFYDPKITDRDLRLPILSEPGNSGRLRFVPDTGGTSNKTALVPQRNSGFLDYQVAADESWAAPCTVKRDKVNNTATVELAIPWKTLADAAIRKDVMSLGFGGSVPWEGKAHELAREFERSAHPVHWQKPASGLRPYTVRLHFCELDDVQAGERTFDVKLQGKVVLENLDVVKAAGGHHIALTKEFGGVMASTEVVLELVPKATQATARTVPILNAIEVSAEPQAMP